MRVQDFNRQDPINQGRPNMFDVDQWLDLVEQYITADEVELALRLLDSPPAWFRVHYPIKAKQLKDELLKTFFGVIDYVKDPVKTEQIGAYCGDIPRGEMVCKYVELYNQNNIIPHINEFAPGNYWLPGLLQSRGLKFSYFGDSIDQELTNRARLKFESVWKDKSESTHDMFIAFEIIEHLHNPIDIYQHYLKHSLDKTRVIFLSTPKFTFGGGMKSWQEKALGHLRAYTPKEFHDYAVKYWPEFKWQLADGDVMCLIGER